MKVIHKLSLSVSAEEKEAFSALDFELKDGFTSLKVEETDPRWPQVSKLCKRFGVVDVAWTKFSNREIEAAKHLQVLTDRQVGYPEPSDDFGYLEESYDTSDHCSACGCGLVQARPFRTARFPRPRTCRFFQLNWVFGELFVALETWGTVFKDLGIDKLPLLKSRRGEAVPDFVQLVIPQTNIGLNLTDLPKGICHRCGRIKYEPFTRGFFPSLIESTLHPLFKPAPYFGSGSSAHHAIIMSGELYKALQVARAHKGLAVMPLAPSEASTCSGQAI